MNFIASAPRSVAGNWRTTLGSDSPVTGDCLLVVLDWVGNSYFGHEALRRGNATPAFQRQAGAAGADTAGYNVLRGLLTPERVNKHTTESGVPLDDEQYAAREAVSHDPDPLFCISALAGAGKTALAHCALKACMDAHSRSSPRRLVTHTVLTRTVRKQVVVELCKLKAAITSALH